MVIPREHDLEIMKAVENVSDLDRASRLRCYTYVHHCAQPQNHVSQGKAEFQRRVQDQHP